MSAFVDRAGKRYGYLTVLRFEALVKHRALWACRCDCGAEAVVAGHCLHAGTTVSCGCYGTRQRSRKGRGATHGQSKTPTYMSWAGMKDRCLNANDPAYPRYGGRGVTICERWVDSFEDFLSDMGERQSGLTLDRHPDNDGNYEPGNCRWATYAEQNLNRRNTRRALYKGELLPLAEIERRSGVKYSTLYYRHILQLAKTQLASIENTDQLAWDE